MADPQTERSSKGKKPVTSGNDGPSLVELSGYNSKRQEFDPEYDNDAEQLLAEMEFKDADSEEERDIKLRVLRIYSKRYAIHTSFLHDCTMHFDCFIILKFLLIL